MLIQGTRIIDVITDEQPPLPDGVLLTDVPNGTILPGLIDGHLHVAGLLAGVMFEVSGEVPRRSGGSSMSAGEPGPMIQPSRWGSDDQIGTGNLLDARLVHRAIAGVKEGRMYDLTQVTSPRSPRLPIQSPYRLSMRWHLIGRGHHHHASAPSDATGFASERAELELHSAAPSRSGRTPSSRRSATLLPTRAPARDRLS